MDYPAIVDSEIVILVIYLSLAIRLYWRPYPEWVVDHTHAMQSEEESLLLPLRIAEPTIFDSRDMATDTSSQAFVDRLTIAGHRLAGHTSWGRLIKDQFQSRDRPCNLTEMSPRLIES